MFGGVEWLPRDEHHRDQATHFLRPATFDVIADARVVRIGHNTSFGRVMMLDAAENRPVGMVASAYSIL